MLESSSRFDKARLDEFMSYNSPTERQDPRWLAISVIGY
jgi:hypothetical protein